MQTWKPKKPILWRFSARNATYFFIKLSLLLSQHLVHLITRLYCEFEYHRSHTVKFRSVSVHTWRPKKNILLTFLVSNRNFLKKKFAFSAKKRQKIGLVGVFRSALKRFEILLSSSDDGQTHWMAAQLDFQDVAIIKKTTLWTKMLRFVPKNVRKMGFLGFSGLHWNASEFYCMTTMILKLTI